MTPAIMSPSTSTGAPTGTPLSISSCRIMSITLYFRNGGPAGVRPRAPSQPNTSPVRTANAPISAMLTCPLIATYGCSARVTISGADIGSSSSHIDGLLQFGDPLTRVCVVLEGYLAQVPGG